MDGLVQHASDCALHNAPAAPPEPCSCGALKRFRLFGYDINRDAFRWRLFCRSTLIADTAATALSRAYGQQKVVSYGTLVGRAVACGLTENERLEIAEAWWLRWSPMDRSFLERNGIADTCSEESGAFVTPEVRAELARDPTDDEIKAALEPWVSWWATKPEPLRPVRGASGKEIAA